MSAQKHTPDPDPWTDALLVVAAFAVLAGIGASLGIPRKLLQRRSTSNETRAIGALKTIGAAQALFREADKESDAELDYGTLAELGAAGLIDEVLASGTKAGYLFEATYGATTSEFIWFATANPIVPGVTGDRYFASNHEGVTYYTSAQPWSLNSVDCYLPCNVQVNCR